LPLETILLVATYVEAIGRSYLMFLLMNCCSPNDQNIANCCFAKMSGACYLTQGQRHSSNRPKIKRIENIDCPIRFCLEIFSQFDISRPYQSKPNIGSIEKSIFQFVYVNHKSQMKAT